MQITTGLTPKALLEGVVPPEELDLNTSPAVQKPKRKYARRKRADDLIEPHRGELQRSPSPDHSRLTILTSFGYSHLSADPTAAELRAIEDGEQGQVVAVDELPGPGQCFTLTGAFDRILGTEHCGCDEDHRGSDVHGRYHQSRRER